MGYIFFSIFNIFIRLLLEISKLNTVAIETGMLLKIS